MHIISLDFFKLYIYEIHIQTLFILMYKKKKINIFYLLQIAMETFRDKNSEHCTKVRSRRFSEESKWKKRSKGETRGQRPTGLTHECGVFGCIAAGDWPSQIDVSQVICLGRFTRFI